jgi:hypothetical protein
MNGKNGGADDLPIGAIGRIVTEVLGKLVILYPQIYPQFLSPFGLDGAAIEKDYSVKVAHFSKDNHCGL